MELTEERCGECGNRQRVCPECSSTKVTPFEPIDASDEILDRPTMGPKEFIKVANDGDYTVFENACWDCGWSEEITVTVKK